MIEIQHTLVHEDIGQEYFVCNPTIAKAPAV